MTRNIPEDVIGFTTVGGYFWWRRRVDNAWQCIHCYVGVQDSKHGGEIAQMHWPQRNETFVLGDTLEFKL